ncbi:hypothetical protein ACFQVC_16310 [Streptomyces monticola]|uniref:O-antigen ligase family protein n=1 Tax=Streptomyces monticola TaxID=2666263 RepID=A0ABW2JJW7_9ACTN
MELILDPSGVLLGTTGLLVCGLLMWSCRRFYAWGIGLYAAVRLWELLQQGGAGGLVGIGIDLMASDLVALCLLCAGAVRLAGTARGAHPALGALFAFAAMWAWSALRGIPDFGLGPAGVEARGLFQLGAVTLYAATLPPTRAALVTVTRIWLGCAAVLCAAATLWWVSIGIGGAGQGVLIGGVVSESRPLGAPAALIIAQAAVLLLFLKGRSPAVRCAAAALVLTVVLLQFRTAWAALVVMLAGLLLTRRAHTSRLTSFAKAATAAAAVLLVGLLGLGGSLADGLLASSQDDTTLSWRVAGWLALLPTVGGPVEWLTGRPFGSGFERLMDGVVVNLSSHNAYLDVLLHLGLLGVGALLLLFLRMWKDAARIPEGPLLRLLVAGQLAFGMTCPLYPEQAILIGLTLALTRAPLPTAASPVAFPAPQTQEPPCPVAPR